MTTQTKHTHILELKEGQPNQYRITVVEDRVGVLLQHVIEHGDGFKTLGYYDTYEALVAVLEPHLAMENSK